VPQDGVLVLQDSQPNRGDGMNRQVCELVRIIGTEGPSQDEWRLIKPHILKAFEHEEKLEKENEQLIEDAKHYEGLDI
jgi:hypothetical protein